MRHYESTLAAIANQVFTAKTAAEAKQLIVDHVSATNVKDKQKMLYDVSQLNNLTRLQTYVANSLLAFEGMRVGKKVA